MITLFQKNILIFLFGLVFLLGGISTASAAADTSKWAFEFKIPNLVTLGVTGVENQVLSYPSLELCQKGESDYNSDMTARVIHKYIITKSCYQTTEKVLVVARDAALEATRAADIGPTALDKFNLWCGLPLPGLSKYNLTDCIPSVVYYVIYKPASWFLIGAGYIFDAMLTLSIDSSFVNQSFIESSWTVVRDFSNMLFIFILLYTGIQTVFGIGNWRSTVIKVIIMALLINFSLFFTKVVIDAGNILAVGIQSSMGTEKSATAQSFQKIGTVAERNISENLVGAFQPQRFLDTAGKVDALDATIVFLIASIVSGYAGYVFFKSALIFIGRLIAFWFLMIVSPFAFISIALPAKANKFQEWLDTLLAQAFVAPVFLFLIYIIMQVVNGGNGILNGLMKSSGTTVGAFTFDKVLAPVVIATLLIMALQQALKYSESMAGDFGKLGSQIGGTAMGIATGGTALAGRAFVGGAAAFALKHGYGGDTAKALTQASFDVRNLGGKDSMFGATIGGGIAKGIGSLGVGKGGGVGGVEKAAKDKVDKDIKKAKEKEMGVFEEEGLRKNSSAATKVIEENLAKEKAKLDTTQAEKDAAEKAENESDERKALDEAKRVHKDASDRLERDKNTEYGAAAQKEFDEAKSNLANAATAHTGASTTVALARTLTKLKDAEKAEAAAQKIAEETDAEKRATWVIEKQNKDRRNTYAEEIQKGNPVAAAKIRKGDKPGGETVEDMIKKQAKKELKEEEDKEKKGSDH